MLSTYKLSILSFLWVCIITFTFAQSGGDIKQYHYGKELLKKGHYEQASFIFKKITKQKKNNLTPYALYFSALSSYYLGDIQNATGLLYHLVAKYSGWEEKQECFYMLACLAYLNGDFEDSYAYSEEITEKDFFKEKIKLKKKLLSLLDLEEVKKLYIINKKDTIVGKALFQIVNNNRENRFNNPHLYKKLERQYNLNKEECLYKKKYNIAVLLPFFLNKIDTNHFENHRLTLDLYEGMKIATDTLSKNGIRFQIFAFDTERDSIKIENILSKPEMEEMDIIIGPIYMNTILPTKKFAEIHEKIIVNPLSKNKRVLDISEKIYTIFPSYNTQGKIAADFAIDSLGSDTTKIIHGSQPRDKAIALAFKRRYEERNKYVKIFHEFDVSDDENTFDTLVQVLNKSPGDTLTGVFISTNHPVIASNIFSALKNVQDPSPIITMSTWLNFRQIPYKQIEENNLYLIYPDYINRNSEVFKSFSKVYMNKQKTIPSIYAFVGYETMYYFARMLTKYGLNFYQELQNESYLLGTFFSGFNYQKGRDNGVVPITKFIDGNLKIVNKSQLRE